MREAKKSLIAKYLLSRHPTLIIDRLKENEVLRSRWDIHTDSFFGVFGEFSIYRRDLFGAIRKVIAQSQDEQLLSHEGEEIIVSKQEGSIFFQIRRKEGETLQVTLDELGMLSSDREERLQALDRALEEIGPTGPDFSALRQAAMERDLSEEEIGEVLEALSHGVAGLQQRIDDRLQAGNATVWDLVPGSLDYFERFCGPDPGERPPDEYLGAVLPEYRKEQLRRDLRRGIEICLIGALRDDLSPGAWLEGISDDELWEALEACQPQIEPFSLLGALDVALYRLHDDRFRALAGDAVVKLVADQFTNADGFDLYQFLPSLAQFALNRIQLLENGTSRAPFWKRMCAWMQANLVMRLLAPLEVDLETVRKRLGSNLAAPGHYATLLDLQREPMYKACEFSSQTLRGEVVGRLVRLQERHQVATRLIPQAEEIGKALSKLEEIGHPLAWSFPGPLEGYGRPEEAGRVLPEPTKAELVKASADLLLVNVVNFSQIFHLDEETRRLFREDISTRSAEGDQTDLNDRLLRLGHAGFVAAAGRDRELAQAISDSILNLAPSLQDGSIIGTGLQALLVASAAFEEEDTWAAWLREQLAGFAGRLPQGRASSSLYDQIQELKKITKLSLGVYNRAEALASAAG